MNRSDTIGYTGRKINQKIYVKKVARLQQKLKERERDEKEEV